MNELLDDEVIARLRSALDEVTDETHGLVPLSDLRPRVSVGRWMAAAAAIVLIAGAVAAIAINRGNARDVASVPTEVATTTPTTEPALIRTVTPWFRLTADDLVPDAPLTLPNMLAENPVGDEVSMVWARNSDPSDALLMLRSGPASPNLAPADTSLADYQMIGDSAVVISSYGLSISEQTQLAGHVVPGSGLPWVLPVEPWTFIGFGNATDGPLREQLYSATAGGTVTISVGPLVNQFLTLATFGSIEPVTVAGSNGWKATAESGVYVVWPAADSGSWAALSISSELADRADDLIGGVVQVTEDSADAPTVETVLAPTETVPPGVDVVNVGGLPLPPFDGSLTTDPAAGLPAPYVGSPDGDVFVDPIEGPHLVVFQANWCPHCAANIAHVVEWVADGTIPSWLPVTLVSTAEDPASANYPISAWLDGLGWTGRVFHDSNEGAGVAGRVANAYGATSYPFFVLIGTDTNVLARAEGDLTKVDVQTLLSGLSAAPSAVGRLQIPSINVDWTVVDSSLGLLGSARLGPVLVSGPLPTQLPIGGDVVERAFIYGNRTTYGAPFLALDQLVVGDTFTWTDESGTATFEVVSIDTCSTECEGGAGSIVLHTTYGPDFDRDSLWVFARRTA